LIKEKIIFYFRTHPNAADSLEGIARFWLRDQDFHISLDELKQILEQLVTEGKVNKSIRSAGGTIYSSSSSNV